jgi:hypothetical protein
MHEDRCENSKGAKYRSAPKCSFDAPPNRRILAGVCDGQERAKDADDHRSGEHGDEWSPEFIATESERGRRVKSTRTSEEQDGKTSQKS